MRDKDIRWVWQCKSCKDKVVSYTDQIHTMDTCKCGESKVDLEVGYCRTSGNLEVLSGINEGDKIIAEGLTKVRPGMKVNPINKSQ